MHTHIDFFVAPKYLCTMLITAKNGLNFTFWRDLALH